MSCFCLAGKERIGRHVTLALCFGTSLTMVCIHSGSIPAAQSACQLPVRQGGDRASRSQVPHRSHQQNRSGNTRLAGECPIRRGRCSRQKGKPAELHGKPNNHHGHTQKKIKMKKYAPWLAYPTSVPVCEATKPTQTDRNRSLR